MRIVRSARRYAAASSGLRMSGFETISIRGTPARLKSTLYADLAGDAVHIHGEAAVLGERLLVLADLVVLRHVRVVVVLAREAVQRVYPAGQRQRRRDAELDGAAVDDRQ